jgi:hypothetical protein
VLEEQFRMLAVVTADHPLDVEPRAISVKALV